MFGGADMWSKLFFQQLRRNSRRTALNLALLAVRINGMEILRDKA